MSWNNKISAEVNIASAFHDITTACNVGQAKNGHGVCLKSVSRTTTMQGFILKAIAAADDKVKSTWSWCVLKECVKHNYVARFHTPSYTAEKCTIFPRLNIKFWQSRWSIKCRSRAPHHIVWLLMTITMQGFILPAITAITVAEKCTFF